MKLKILFKLLLTFITITSLFASCSSDDDNNDDIDKNNLSTLLEGTYKGTLNQLSTSQTIYDAIVTITKVSDTKIKVSTNQENESVELDIEKSKNGQITAKSGEITLKYSAINNFLEIYTNEMRTTSTNTKFTFRGSKQGETSNTTGTPGSSQLLATMYKGTLTHLEEEETINDATVAISMISETKVWIVTLHGDTEQEVELIQSGDSIFGEAANITLKYSIKNKTISITTYKINSTDKIYSFKGARVESDSEDNDTEKEDNIEFTINATGRSFYYTYNVSNSLSSTLPDGSLMEVLVFDGNSYSNNYGSYNGANINFSYYLQGEGVYKIVTTEEFVKNDNKNKKVIVVNLTIGNGNSTGFRSYNITGGNATVKIVNEKYHITINNPVIAKSIVEYGDYTNIAETVTLTVNDAYSHE